MGKTILVVEDDPNMLDLIALRLRAAGYFVCVAANGLEAAASCLKVVPDLIVSDVWMPRMSGFDMIRILKSEAAMQDIPVIFLTADEGGRDLGGKLGAVAYLSKPIDAGALLKVVAKQLPVNR